MYIRWRCCVCFCAKSIKSSFLFYCYARFSMLITINVDYVRIKCKIHAATHSSHRRRLTSAKMLLALAIVATFLNLCVAQEIEFEDCGNRIRCRAN